MSAEFLQKWKSQVKKGTLEFILLSVLQGKELYGYELIEESKKYASIDIAEGTLYPLMNRLRKANLVQSRWVEQESGIPRKYYTITNPGNAMLKDMRQYWEGLNSTIHKLSKDHEEITV
ncbi:MAG: PadR family transcriptional regulator [Bacteroidota bacterium]